MKIKWAPTIATAPLIFGLGIFMGHSIAYSLFVVVAFSLIASNV